MASEENWSCPDLAERVGAAQTGTPPFAMPGSLPAPLAHLHDHWDRLKRGNADIPFADDVALGAIDRVGTLAFLIDVFANPLRFRFGEIGSKAKAGYAHDLGGRFLGEIERLTPLDFLLSQCAATVEARAPTYYAGADVKGAPYHRLLMPLWADGRIAALLGAIVE